MNRRHVRMPAAEAWQLGCGLAIPFLMLPHAVNVRVGSAAYGLDESYYRILYQYWLTSPALGLTRQFALLALVWRRSAPTASSWLARATTSSIA